MISLNNFYSAFKSSSLYRRLAKNFSISLAGSGVTMGIGIIQTALITKSIAVSDYGKILIVINFFSFLQMFLDVRVQDVFFRFFPEFEKSKEYGAIQGIILLGLGLGAAIGLLIALGMYFSAQFIADTFYGDHSLTILFRTYIIAAFFIGFTGFYSSLLRLHDKFSKIVVPQVTGALITVSCLTVYFVFYEKHTLVTVIMIMTVGAVYKSLIPFYIALKTIKPYFKVSFRDSITAIRPYKSRLLSTIFQTNITGYLKLGADTGGMFLLGILSTPSQVAYYGIAKQLIKPLSILQNNIQTALTPEIASLWAQKKISQLYRLIKRISTGALFVGGIVVVMAYLLIKPVIILVTTNEYLNALPVFYIIILTVFLTFVSLPYFTLALCMDQLKKRNLVVSIRFVYLGVAIVFGLDAFRLAIVQFFGVLTTLLFNDFSLLKTVRLMSKNN